MPRLPLRGLAMGLAATTVGLGLAAVSYLGAGGADLTTQISGVAPLPVPSRTVAGAAPGTTTPSPGTSAGAPTASSTVTPVPPGAPGTPSRPAAASGPARTTNRWVAAATCAEPAPIPLPAKRSVVGRGTTATCTEGALRAAIGAGGLVTFDCGPGAVTIPVSQEITTRGTTVIDGGGKVTLDGRKGNRILVVGQDATLSVRNLRFVDGRATQRGKAELGGGGAIVGYFRTRLEVVASTFENNTAGMGGGAVMIGTEGRLSITRSLFRGNVSAYGGAVYSLLAQLTVMNSNFVQNSGVNRGGGGDGGAIGTDGGAPPNAGSRGGEIRICGSTFTGNSGRGSGGGVYLWGYARDRIIVERNTFQGNTVDGIGGGARISLGKTDHASVGTIIVSGTSFLSNTASGNGGGLYVDCLSVCDVENTTFFKNTSKAYGGAIFGDGHHDTNVTFAQNHANGHGGALFGGKFVLNNTVFVGNSAGNPWGQAMSCSQTGTGSHVLQWGTTSRDGSTSCIAGVTAANPRLANPAANGGPTATMLPAPGSPALGAGAGCTPRDQRGIVRRSGACDLGAVQRS